MTESFRDRGNIALKTVINSEKNIKIVEKNLYEKSIGNNDSETEKNYLSNVYQIIYDISEGKLLNNILLDIKSGKLGWSHEALSKFHASMEEQDNFIENPFEVAEGVLECRKVLENGKICGSKRVFSYSRQQRSADEPMTTFATCCACGTKWTYSG